MALEIERKFLVNHQAWPALPKPSGVRYIQGYLDTSAEKTIRIRIAGDKGFITIKGPPEKGVRKEFEYGIPLAEAEEILKMAGNCLVEKTRYRILFNGKTWEVDEFSGDNKGLILAEIELETIDEAFTIPPWIGREVTEDARYQNSYLASNPFKNWERL